MRPDISIEREYCVAVDPSIQASKVLRTVMPRAFDGLKQALEVNAKLNSGIRSDRLVARFCVSSHCTINLLHNVTRHPVRAKDFQLQNRPTRAHAIVLLIILPEEVPRLEFPFHHLASILDSSLASPVFGDWTRIDQRGIDHNCLISVDRKRRLK